MHYGQPQQGPAAFQPAYNQAHQPHQTPANPQWSPYDLSDSSYSQPPGAYGGPSPNAAFPASAPPHQNGYSQPPAHNGYSPAPHSQFDRAYPQMGMQQQPPPPPPQHGRQQYPGAAAQPHQQQPTYHQPYAPAGSGYPYGGAGYGDGANGYSSQYQGQGQGQRGGGWMRSEQGGGYGGAAAYAPQQHPAYSPTGPLPADGRGPYPAHPTSSSVPADAARNPDGTPAPLSAASPAFAAGKHPPRNPDGSVSTLDVTAPAFSATNPVLQSADGGGAPSYPTHRSSDGSVGTSSALDASAPSFVASKQAHRNPNGGGGSLDASAPSFTSAAKPTLRNPDGSASSLDAAAPSFVASKTTLRNPDGSIPALDAAAPSFVASKTTLRNPDGSMPALDAAAPAFVTSSALDASAPSFTSSKTTLRNPDGSISSLDATAPSFFPKAATAPPAGSAKPRAARYAPPKTRPSEMKPDAIEKFADRVLTGIVQTYDREKNAGTIESKEVRETLDSVVSWYGSQCRGLKMRTGIKVQFKLSMQRYCTAVSITPPEADDKRYIGVVSDLHADKKSGVITPRDDIRKPQHDLPAQVEFSHGSTTHNISLGARVSFKLKSPPAAPVEDPTPNLATDLIILPKSLEELPLAEYPKNFKVPTVAPPNPGQNPWELDVVLFHSSCWDGIGAAYAIYNAAGAHRDEIVFVPVNSSAEEGAIPDLTGKNVALVDVAYGEAKMREVLKATASLLIIDHHASSSRINCEGNADVVRFDLDFSAATLAWEFCRTAVLNGPSWLNVKHDKIPMFLSLISEVDLGRFGIEYPIPRRWAIGIDVFPFSEEFDEGGFALPRHTCAGPATFKFVHSCLKKVHTLISRGDDVVGRILKAGELAEIDLEEQVHEWMSLVTTRRFIKAPEFKVAVVVLEQDLNRGGKLLPFRFARNELGHRLARLPGVDFGCVVAGRAVMLRCDAGKDVSQLATMHGGGGHTTAAAFQIEDDYDCNELFVSE
ncbi:hypothetical protein DIPPA_17784 [Diplonema papillatum]|nr:hypothetical protein DIPPA_17784 [Diplonema papillatum]